MAGSNGKAAQHHMSAREIVALHKARSYQQWHWDALDLDFLIRPRSSAETALLADEGQRLTTDIEQYAGTVDAPGMIEQLRLGLRAALPLLLDPETKEPYFGIDEVDDLLELPMAAINELIEAANRASNFTEADAETAAKNSGETAASSIGAVSPSAAATSTSSPTPTR